MAEEERSGFELKRVKRSELLAFLGAIVLAVSLFVAPWFSTDCPTRKAAHAARQPGTGHCDRNSQLKLASGQLRYGSYSGWQVYKFVRWALLAACIAPFVLAYIIARGHELSWRPGEVTMIIGIVAIALILLDGIILGRPGNKEKYGVEISIEYGYFIGIAGAFLMSFGGFRRQAEQAKPQPPGV